MAYSIVKDSGTQTGYSANNTREYMVDSESDIASIPADCSIGSIAYTADLEKVWVLNNQRQWTKAL